jgi:hypothetical protein
MAMTTATRFGLGKTEVIRFRDQGYLLGPYDLCSPDEMAAIRERVDVEVLGTDPPFAQAIPPEGLSRPLLKLAECGGWESSELYASARSRGDRKGPASGHTTMAAPLVRIDPGPIVALGPVSSHA